MVKILDIEIYSNDIPTAVKEMVSLIVSNESKENRLISATNAHGLTTAKKDKDFKNILDHFHFNLPDGMPCVWIGKLKGAREMKRCYGPDFFAMMMQYSADKPVKHFFCGGKEGVAIELSNACLEKFCNYNIVGTYCPSFNEINDEELRSVGRDITQSGANIVWIGMSTPKQEKFAYRLRDFTKVDFIIAVGAAFDFHTGRVKQAPHWMQQSGLEWFFRLLMEPKRLFRRYSEAVPSFIFYNLKEVLTNGVKKIKITLMKLPAKT